MAPVTFGDLLRAHRKRAGLTQSAVAHALGIDFTYISKIERGRAAPPSTDIIAVAASVLRLSADERDQLFAAAAKLPAELEQWAASTAEVMKLYRHLSSYPKKKQASLLNHLVKTVLRAGSAPAAKGSKGDRHER
jgi:transcriptional regulator with XRE-family HTH domain